MLSEIVATDHGLHNMTPKDITLSVIVVGKMTMGREVKLMLRYFLSKIVLLNSAKVNQWIPLAINKPTIG